MPENVISLVQNKALMIREYMDPMRYAAMQYAKCTKTETELLMEIFGY